MSHRAERHGKHRSKPRRFSSARIYGTLDGWTKFHKIHGAKMIAQVPADWGLDIRIGKQPR